MLVPVSSEALLPLSLLTPFSRARLRSSNDVWLDDALCDGSSPNRPLGLGSSAGSGQTVEGRMTGSPTPVSAVALFVDAGSVLLEADAAFLALVGWPFPGGA